MERRIIIGLITSTEYCSQIKDIWNVRLLESATAKRIANWVWEYFDEYKEAPNREIESIYLAKKSERNFPKDIAEEIEEDILPGLSEEYDREGFNLRHLVKDTERYFNTRYIQLFVEELKSLAEEKEEAEKKIKEFKLPSVNIDDLNKHVLSVTEIRRKNKPRPILYMRPWLRAGQTTLIYGGYGSGKSLLSLSIAYVLGIQDWEDNSDCEIGPWMVENPTGCLYVDGELGEQEVEERIKQFEWIGRQSQKHRLKVFSIPDYQLETEDSFFLSERKNQQKILKWLIDHPDYRVIILDSITTLFGLLDENSNAEWNNKINPFIRDLRALGVANIFLHHSGKDGKKGLRGASAMGAMAHAIFRITDHKDKAIDDGEAWFVLSKDKQRKSGFSFKNFALKYQQNPNQTETYWEETELPPSKFV